MAAASHLCGCHQNIQAAHYQGGHLVRATIGDVSRSIGENFAVRNIQVRHHHLEGLLNVIYLSWVNSHLPTSDEPRQFWTEHLCAHPRCHIAGRRACEINVLGSPAQGWERVASLRFAQRPEPTLHRFAQPQAQDPNTIVELQVSVLQQATFVDKTVGAILIVGLGIS